MRINKNKPHYLPGRGSIYASVLPLCTRHFKTVMAHTPTEVWVNDFKRLSDSQERNAVALSCMRRHSGSLLIRERGIKTTRHHFHLSDNYQTV